MNANFLRFLGITTLTLTLAAQLAMPAAPTVPMRDNSRERPIAFEPTPTPSPTPDGLGGQCTGGTCG